MNEREVDSAKLEELMVRFLQYDLSAEDQLSLARCLERDETARQLFASHVRLEGDFWHLGRAGCLVDECLAEPFTESETTIESPLVSPPQSTEVRRHDRRVALVAVSGMVAAALAIWFGLGRRAYFGAEELPVFAYVDRVVGVAWDNSVEGFQPGDALGSSVLRINGGLVDLKFSCGARVILEGPAEFDVVSATRGYVKSGQLRSIVPPEAKGFTIGTPDVDVEDLGTEFGLRIHESGDTEVHVFDGLVQIHSVDGQSDASMLSAGAAVRVGLAGQPNDVDSTEEDFVGVALLDSVAREYELLAGDDVAELEQQLQQLRERIDIRQQEISKNRDWRIVRSELEQSRDAINQYRVQHPELAAWEDAILEKKRRLDEVIRTDFHFRENWRLRREVRNRLIELDERRADIKRRNGSDGWRRWKSKRKSLAQERRAIDREFVRLRRRILASDPVRQAKRELGQARKELREFAGKEYRALQRSLNEARSRQRRLWKKLLDTDEQFRSMRAQVRVVQLRLREAHNRAPVAA